jgi:hypothetical protein
MFRWRKKDAAISLNCPKCRTPPAQATHCPQCGKAILRSRWITLRSVEVEFEEFDEAKEVFVRMFIRVSGASEEEVSGVWRLADEVRRSFKLRLGEWEEWEVQPAREVEYYDDGLQREMPLNVIHRVGYLDFDPNGGSVTLAVRTVARVRVKSSKM